MKLHPIPPGLFCVPSALVSITGADIESVINPAINRHSEHHSLLDTVPGVSRSVTTAVLKKLGYNVRLYKQSATSGALRAHVSTWAERSLKYVDRVVLLSTGKHMLVCQNGRIYDTFTPHGVVGIKHPYAKTTITWAALIENMN